MLALSVRRVALSRTCSRSQACRWLVTARQKRGLNKDQLEGSGDNVPPPPPPTSPASTTPASLSGGGGNNMLPIAIVGGLALAGGAYYTFSGSSSSTVAPVTAPADAMKEVKTTTKEVKTTKEEVETTKKDVVASKAAAADEVAAPSSKPEPVKAEPNRVVSIQVPAKMKNVAAAAVVATIPEHPESGNRVSIMPSPKLTRTETIVVADTTMTDKAVAELKASTTQQASEAVVESHQSLWSAMDASFFADLDSLNPSQLKARIVQLASDMKDRTKWEAVRLKEFLAMQEKETADKYLDIIQKQRLEFEDILAKRLREQEHAMSQQLHSALQEKEVSIQHVLDTALEAQKHEHEEDKKAFEETKSAELKSQIGEEMRQKVEEVKKQVATDLQRKVAVLESLTAKLKHLESALAASQTSQKGSLIAHRLSAAALALSEKLETNKPAATELKALRAAAAEGGVVATALVTIPDAVNTGVPTLPELQVRFDEVHKRCRQAALVPKGREGLEGQLAGIVFAALKYPPNPDDAAPESDKGNAEYVLVRARQHVQLGELELAVEQMEKLNGQVAFTAQDWKKDAMDRIAVEKALKVIKMECALVNESLADE